MKERVRDRKQPVEQRIKNFNEVAFGFDEKQAVEEASRCLQCKNAPCVKGCPVEIDIPKFIKEIKEGNFEKALSIPGHPLYPFLISLLSRDPGHVEIVGRLISLFFGIITFFIIYLLIKEEIGQKEALLTILFYTFHPYLVTYSGMMLTEATYWGLLVLSIYFFWTGLRREKIWRMIPAGIFLGLSYLTRPEGIGYIFIYLIWIIVVVIIRNKKWLKGLIQLVLLIIFTFIFALPYILYIHKETGHWLISKKAVWVKSQISGKDVMEIEPSKDIKLKNPKTINAPGSLLILKNILNNFLFVLYHYFRAYHFSLWIFLFFGLIICRSRIHYIEIFFISLILFHLLSLSTFTESTIRFSVPIIPISLIWAGAGVLEIEKLFKKINASKALVWVSTLTIIVLFVQLPQSLKPERKHRAYQKEVGLWLKKNTPKDSIIMSNSPQETFYAEREFIMFPQKSPSVKRSIDSYQDVIRYAREKGVKYILIDKNTYEINKGFVEMVVSQNLNTSKDI
ncbi:MAG: glycosyltransferase family 39 protein, partial [Candidatus Ratteibacteria bacterium]